MMEESFKGLRDIDVNLSAIRAGLIALLSHAVCISPAMYFSGYAFLYIACEHK